MVTGAVLSTPKPLLVACEPPPPTATIVWLPSDGPAGTVTVNPLAAPLPSTAPTLAVSIVPPALSRWNVTLSPALKWLMEPPATVPGVLSCWPAATEKVAALTTTGSRALSAPVQRAILGVTA